MSEVLRDPMWQFIIGLLAAIGAILVPVCVYMKQRTRKSLSYETISFNPLLSVEKEIQDDLQIVYRGKPVKQVHLVIVRIFNSGNMPILSTDYEHPISLSFGEKAHILTTEITEKNPDSLQPSAKVEEKRVVLTPILLNQGDSVTLKMLVTGLQGQPKIDGRVAGVRNINESKEHLFRYVIIAIIGLAVEFSSAFFLLEPLKTLLAVSGAFVAATAVLYLFRRLTRSTRKR